MSMLRRFGSVARAARCAPLAARAPLGAAVARRFVSGDTPVAFEDDRKTYNTSVQWLGNLDFVCRDGDGNGVLLSGGNLGVSPMQVMLMALGSCATVDVVGILRKQRQDVRDVRVSVDAQRGTEGPRPWERIRMHLTVVGKELDEQRVLRAAKMSAEKYCGVHASLSGAADISITVEAVDPEDFHEAQKAAAESK